MRAIFVLIGASILYVLAAGIMPAVLLAPQGVQWWKAVGGALIAMLAPISIGGFIGFQLSLKEDEASFGAKLVRYALAAIGGASAAQYKIVLSTTTTWVIACAQSLSLAPVVLVLLFPMFSLPAWYLGYHFNKDGLKWLFGALETILHLISRNASTRDLARFELATDSMKRGEHKIALAAFQTITHKEPFEPGLSRIMAQCYHHVGDFENELKHLNIYLGKQRMDKDAIKDLVSAGHLQHDKLAKKAEKTLLASIMREQVRTYLQDDIVMETEIHAVWPGLVSGDTNDKP